MDNEKDLEIDIKDYDYDNDSLLTGEDDTFNLSSQIALTPTVQSNTQSNSPKISQITNQTINPIVNNDPNSFIVLNILDSENKLPELVKLSNNLKPNEELDKSKIEAESSKDLAMPKLEYTNVPDLESDFQLARRNLIALTKHGTTVVEDMIALAKSTEHPNTYKTLNETLSTFSQLNKDLLELYKSKVDIEKKIGGAENVSVSSGTTNNQSNVQNNFFVGTTDELLAKIAREGLNTLDNVIIPLEQNEEE